MLEAMIVVCIISMALYLPLRGKQIDDLSPSQLQRVEKNLTRYNKTKKGQKEPKTREDMLVVLQKQGISFLILLCVLVPIYILAIIFLYPTLVQ